MQIEPGKIFYSPWGYEQTNIDFYEVTKVSNSMVTIRKVAKDVMENDMRGTCTPRIGEYTGDPIRRKVRTYSDEPTLKLNSYSFAYPWDGKPKNFTSYA